MDSNPRHFFVDVTAMEANVDPRHQDDFLTIEFHGTVTPTLRTRLMKAIAEGNFEITTKKFG